MNNILICANMQRDDGLLATHAVLSFIRALGASPELSLLFPDAGAAAPAGLAAVPFDEAIGRAGLVICLGGDGTILHVAKTACERDIPILGVNIGRTGFLADLEVNDFPLLEKVLRGDYMCDVRMMIDVSVCRGGKEIFRDFGLNDAVISRGNVGRIIELSLGGGGKRIYRFSGDGIIIATPTGSTAYSLAAGGSIVEPSAENIIITPICAHTLKVKPLVMSGSAEVEVELGELRDKTAFLSVDGADSAELRSGDVIRVTKSARRTRLVRVLNKSFYDIVSRKLNSEDAI